MQILGPTTESSSPAFALGLDMSHIVTKVRTVAEARALPRGSVIGDLHGGLTFTDSVAAVLEGRSNRGWHDVQTAPGGDVWTVILLDR